MSEQEMRISDVISLIENHKDTSQYKKAKKVLKTRLAELTSENYEEWGTVNYYLLMATLHEKMHYETKEAHEYYQQMRRAFVLRRQDLIKNLRREKRERDKNAVFIRKMQIKAFYRLMEQYFGSLEVEYDKKDFLEAVERAYYDKMTFRKYAYRHNRNYLEYVMYAAMDVTSRYGNSFFRWGITGIVSIVMFGVVFYLIDLLDSHSDCMVNTACQIGNYIYYSAVTFTTLGYGEIVPHTAWQKLLVGVEVFFGYVMLGMFINLIQKKL